MDAAFLGTDAEAVLAWVNGGDIFLNISSNNGSIWPGAAANISSSAGPSVNPAVAVVPETDVHASLIVVAWEENGEIFLARSDDDGASFFQTPDPLVNVSRTAGPSTEPAVAISALDLSFVAWQEEVGPSNHDIFVTRSIDGAREFDPVPPLNLRPALNVSDSVEDSVFPAIAAIDDIVLVAWVEATASLPRVHVARSDDGGLTFDDPIDVSSSAPNPAAFIGSVGIAMNDDDRAMVVWSDIDIHAAFTTDGGISFSNPINVSNDPGNSTNPVIGTDPYLPFNDELIIAWEDTTENEIFAVRAIWESSTPTFDAVVNISGDVASAGGSGGSFPPAVAIFGSATLILGDLVVFAWSDNTQSTSIDIIATRRRVGDITEPF